MLLKPKKNDASPKERALWADLMSLGFVFPIAIVLGFFLGRWIGGLIGHPEGGQWIGLLWGIATGFWELYKVTLRANALDDTRDDSKDDHGDGKGTGAGGA
jgi:hypothetical protein